MVEYLLESIHSCEIEDSHEFNEWANMLLKRSAHNFNTSINEIDKVLTLSTCYNDEEKVVLHAN